MAHSSTSDPPYDPKEGLSGSGPEVHAFSDRRTDTMVYERHTSVPHGDYRNSVPSPYDAHNGKPRGLMDRIGVRVPLEDRLSTPARPDLGASSLQERIGERAPLSTTPVLSPSLGSHPDRYDGQHSPRQKPYDASEEVIRQAIYEHNTSAASEDRGRKPSLESRFDLERDRPSYPPKFAAKRGEIFPPPDRDHVREHSTNSNGNARRWSNASRPSASDESPSRRDRESISAPAHPNPNGPLSWDREPSREPPAVYPPPPPSTGEFDTRYPYNGGGPYREREYGRMRRGGGMGGGIGRTPSPRRHPSGPNDYTHAHPAPPRGPKRGRDEDYYDMYDRRYADHYAHGRTPSVPAVGYYDERERGAFPPPPTPRSADVYEYAGPPRGPYHRPEAAYMPPPRTA